MPWGYSPRNRQRKNSRWGAVAGAAERIRFEKWREGDRPLFLSVRRGVEIQRHRESFADDDLKGFSDTILL